MGSNLSKKATGFKKKLNFSIHIDGINSKVLQKIIFQERFGNMTRVYYKEAVGAFIVFDMTRIDSFEGTNSVCTKIAIIFFSDTPNMDF